LTQESQNPIKDLPAKKRKWDNLENFIEEAETSASTQQQRKLFVLPTPKFSKN